MPHKKSLQWVLAGRKPFSPWKGITRVVEFTPGLNGSMPALLSRRKILSLPHSDPHHLVQYLVLSLGLHLGLSENIVKMSEGKKLITFSKWRRHSK